MDIEKILDLLYLAEELPEQERKKIESVVVDGFKSDLESRSEWDTQHELALRLAQQVLESKNHPWPNASNVKYPLMSIAAIQFAARAYPAILPNRSVVRCYVTGDDSSGMKARRGGNIAQHMNYQLFEEMEEWEEDMDKLLHILPVLGVCFKKTYYNVKLGRNVSELVMPGDFVVDYYAKSLEDAVRKTHVIRLTPNEYVEGVRLGKYRDVELAMPTTDEMKDKTGSMNPVLSFDEDDDYIFLEQHRYWDLDGDGYEEPYIVTVHYKSGEMICMQPRYGMDSVNRNDKDEVTYIKPDEYFVKYSFIPAPDGGFYDIGFGRLLGPINETVNTTINQLLDAGTLNNTGGGWLGRGIRMKTGEQRFRLGEWKTVDAPGDDIRKNIVPRPMVEPSTVLFSLLGEMIQAGEKLASIVDPLTGESPGANVPATSTLALIEQGLKVFSGINKRIHRSFKKELKKLYELNKAYLTQEAYYRVLDPVGEGMEQGQEMMVSRTDYQDDMSDVQPITDPNAISDAQRLAKVQALMPFLDDRDFDPMEIKRRYVEALQIPDSQKVLRQGEKPPDPDLLIKTAQVEHEKYKLDIRRFEEEFRSLERLANTIAKLNSEELEVGDKDYGEAITKLFALLDAIKRRSDETDKRGFQGMDGQPGNEGNPGNVAGAQPGGM